MFTCKSGPQRVEETVKRGGIMMLSPKFILRTFWRQKKVDQNLASYNLCVIYFLKSSCCFDTDGGMKVRRR